MTIPQSKGELITAIDQSFAKLEHTIKKIPPIKTDQNLLSGHAKNTKMSPNDLLAYLIGWNALVLKWLKLDDAGQTIDFPETGYKWNQLGTLAQDFYTHYPTLNFQQRTILLQQKQKNIQATILKYSDAELYGQPWYKKHSKGRMIQLNTVSPYKNARNRLLPLIKK